MEPEVLQTLRFSNPWFFPGGRSAKEEADRRLPGRWIARHQLRPDELFRPGEDRAHLVTGPRQAGKSSLVWSALGDQPRPLVLDLEEHTVRTWCRSPTRLLGELRELGPPPDVLFLEEAQWLEDLALFVKGLVDARPGFPIVVTGSASFQLRARFRESLAGRARRSVLLPFGLGEVAPAGALPPALLQASRADAVERMLAVGGYPRVWLSDEPWAVLSELVESFVFRDASDLFGVERIDAFAALLRLAAGQVGGLVNVSEWASRCGVAADTVSRYLSMMEAAHLLEAIPAFSGGKRREVTSARKVYFADNGLRASLLALSGTPSPAETGARTENLVFSELRKGLPWSQTVRYWRSTSKAEVDFVVPRGDRLLGIEVKAAAMPRPKLARSSRSFVEAYAPGELWVVNRTLVHEERLGTTRVRWVRLGDLPELLATWLVPSAREEHGRQRV